MNNKESSTESENNNQMKVFLPNKLLECLPRTTTLPKERLRWNTNEEIASYLISFDRHEEWLSCTLKTRPQNGSIILYNRKKVKYRKDGYCWKKRKDGKTTREDHMKLKVQGMECLYGCYVHSSIVPTFHRRCYWLLQNPDIVLVHYLNVPSLEDCGKACGPLLCAVADRRDSLRWSREELLSQLKPMFHSMKWSCGNGNGTGTGNGSTELSIEQLVQQILESQQTKPQPRTHTCLCNPTLASPGANIPHRCNSTKHRIISPKLPARPSVYPALTEVQNLANDTSVGVASREAGAGDSSMGGVATERKPGLGRQGGSSPAVIKDNGNVSSPCSATSSSSSSPPQTQRAATIALSNGNGFYGDQCSGLAAVALPQNAVIVMTTAAAIGHGGEESKSKLASTGLSLTHSGRLVLSPVPPKPDTPSPPTVASPPSPAPPPHTVSSTPGVATLSLTLLPSPVIGGLLLTDHLITEPPSTLIHSSTSPTPSFRPPAPPPAAPSPSLPPPSPPVLSPSLPVPFDPDAFLNSPKQGQTYGGPSVPAQKSSHSLSASPSSPPLSSSPQPPSLALSLSPSSPPSSSPSSSLSSLSETERKSTERELQSLSTTPTSTPSSSSLSPSLSLSLSPSRSAPSLLPLCLDSSLGLDSLTQPLSPTLDPQQPPTKLALIHSRPSPGSPQQQARSPRLQTPDHTPDSPEMQLIGCDTQAPPNQMSLNESPNSDLSMDQQPANQLSPNQLSMIQSTNQLSPNRLSSTEFQNHQLNANQLSINQILPNQLSPKQLQTSRTQAEIDKPEQRQQQQQLLMLQQHRHGQSMLVTTDMTQSSPPEMQQPLLRHNHNQPLLLSSQTPPPQPRHQEGSVTGEGLLFSLRGSQNSVRVKEEQSSPLSPTTLDSLDPEETPMDTTQNGSSHSGPMGSEVTELSFDSAFPDLISELITEDAQEAVSHNPALAPAAAPTSAPHVYPVRYMVPPQPTPSTSFLPYSLVTHTQPQDEAGADQRRLANITDFSPEWSYPEGGVKVLITGPWAEATGRYSCVFDQSTVPASLIQPGVLRCYCPAHEAGLVALHVLEDSGAVSTSVLFEYRARNASSLPSSQLDWLSLDDNQFRMSILERLEQMERRMAEMSSNSNHHQQQQQQQQQQQKNQQHLSSQNPSLSAPGPDPEDRNQSQSGPWFERRIVSVCERMMAGGRWGGGERLVHSVRHRGMTLLHLAAAQGYTQLIHTLIQWRSVNADSLDLEQEVDPLNVDHFSCTPLMWACALGHQAAAVLLYRWSSVALGIPDSLGRLPLAVARSRGHTRLARCLEELHTQTQAQDHTLTQEMSPSPQLPLSPLSTSPDTGLSSSSSIPSPSDPPSPSPSSAYSSGSVRLGSPLQSTPDPMDTSSPSSPSSPSSLPLSSPSPSLPLPSWVQDCEGGDSSLPPGPREPLFLMDYEPTSPNSSATAHSHSPHSAFEAELLNYSENVENEDYLPAEVLQVDMATLAEQIIEATPERIKQEEFSREAESPLRERQDNAAIHDTMPWLATYLDTVDTFPSRCACPTPPPSSRSPQPPSPLSALALQRLRPPSSAAWAEFLNASANGRMERDFALLTLTDSEQRELYEAARIIQNAFRRYKGRRLKEQQDMAAAVIQRCYRKYKQYALYKKMTQAAILIQSKFRSYYEQKKFQQSRRAAVLIQQYYRSYKEYERLKQGPRGSGALNTKIKGSFLTKKQDQAARKIMRFLRRCRHRIKELKQSKESERRGLTT
ncbi:calmodulin-binding transcription activator 2 [Chanos chanos]|uniref:Calmodulin-binding transcription activator 1 n=1 Tax=Chanos chanos TaxID=29144 RepID=A0A6J2VKP4_CHACN|nr:calmodulin-binding transcription activator 2-like [Chanos chanos]